MWDNFFYTNFKLSYQNQHSSILVIKLSKSLYEFSFNLCYYYFEKKLQHNSWFWSINSLYRRIIWLLHHSKISFIIFSIHMKIIDQLQIIWKKNFFFKIFYHIISLKRNTCFIYKKIMNIRKSMNKYSNYNKRNQLLNKSYSNKHSIKYFFNI